MAATPERCDMGSLSTLRTTVRRSRLGWGIVAPLSLIAGIGCSSDSTPDLADDITQPAAASSALSRMVASEVAFATAASETSVIEAFRTFIAPDGVLFRPGPTEAGPWLDDQEPGDGQLQWVPTHAGIASSGDLGYTTGPYRAGAEDDASWGHYVSVWKRGANGTFRVALDIGTSHPALEAGLPPFESTTLEDDSLASVSQPVADSPTSEHQDQLLAVDAQFGRVLGTQGLASAMQEFGTASARVHRTGVYPITEREDLRSSPLAEERSTLTSVGAEASQSGTFGFTYGTTSEVGDEGSSGNYLAIWRRDPGDVWTLALFLSDAP